jgi:glucose-6-phosphate 1-dehydrogenase
MPEPGRSLVPQPCTVVIFGGSGDLARRKLVPALYNLLLDGLLPENSAVLGTGRKPMTDEQFRDSVREGITKYSRQPLQADMWARFAPRLFYVAGGIDEPAAYAQMHERLTQLGSEHKLSNNRMFYLAIPPTSIAPAVQGLQKAGLVQPSKGPFPFSRVVVEKPIGHDLSSACEINESVAQVFDESQIFRIDHYLGKETVQNILVLRFANSILEPIWNHKYVDHVQITVSEAEGVGTRATYYDGAGALRDMVQNHIIQLLCLIAMEPPNSLDPDVVRNARMEVLQCLHPIRGKDVETYTVRAQYASGNVGGAEHAGYRREAGIKPDSATETYVALKMFVENWRWSGVPFYVRTGKALKKRASEIAVTFKSIPQILFNTNLDASLAPNVLALKIQPEEGLSLRLMSKVPGTKAKTNPVDLNFRYGEAFSAPSPEAYERLLLDVMAGDGSLFMRRDAIEASWGWINDILDGWKSHGSKWLPEYPIGTWGPVEADRLIGSDGRTWRVL